MAASTHYHFTQEAEEEALGGAEPSTARSWGSNASHLAPSSTLSCYCFEEQWGTLIWGSKEKVVDSRGHEVGAKA